MKKIILTLSLFGIISSVNAEMIAPGVELLSHKTWTTGKNTVSASSRVILLDDNKKKLFSSANVGVWVDSVYGHVYHNILTSASHFFSIRNTSDQIQKYTVVMKICADTENCSYDSRKYNIEGHQSLSMMGETLLAVSFSEAGNYSLIAGTFISGTEKASITHSATIFIREKDH